MNGSVRPPVTPFSPYSHHRFIMIFSGIITLNKGDVHAKDQCQRSMSQRLRPNLAVSPVWIHVWQRNDAKALCGIGEVPYCFPGSSVKCQGHPRQKITDFDLDWAFLDCNSSLNSPMASKWRTKLDRRSIEEVSYCFSRSSIKFQGHTGQKNDYFNPIWVRLLGRS